MSRGPEGAPSRRGAGRGAAFVLGPALIVLTVFLIRALVFTTRGALDRDWVAFLLGPSVLGLHPAMTYAVLRFRLRDRRDPEGGRRCASRRVP